VIHVFVAFSNLQICILFNHSSICDQSRLHQSLLEFINILERHLVDTLLYDSQTLLLGARDLDRYNLLKFFHTFQHMMCLVGFPQVVQEQKSWVRWELKQLFSSQWCQKYLYQKLLKSDDISSSYSR